MDDTEYNHLYENFRYQTIPANDGTCKISWFNADNTPIAWSACTKEDDGVYRRMRVANITQYPSSGNVCPDIVQKQICPKTDCKVKEVPYLETQCYLDPNESDPNKKYKKTKFYEIEVTGANGGKSCGPLFETTSVGCEYIPCQATDWKYTDCYQTGPASNPRYERMGFREIIQFPKNGPLDTCPSPLVKYETCPPQDPIISTFGPSDCYLGPDNKPRRITVKKVLSLPKYGSTATINEEELKVEEDCEQKDCIVGWNGVQGAWSVPDNEWQSYDKCYEDPSNQGKYIQTRIRQVLQYPLNGGAKCGELIETTECKGVKDCQGSYSDWSDCFPKDGKFYQSRVFNITQYPTYNGQECPPIYETKECKPISCELEWDKDWSQCYVEGETAQRIKTAKVVTYPNYGGTGCGELYQTTTDGCESKDCEVGWNGVKGDWSPPTDCYLKDDGKWYQTRTRTVITMPEGAGKDCDSLIQESQCQPTDCKYGDWEPFTDCYLSREGKYVKSRKREITKLPTNGGAECPELTETVDCENIDCEVGFDGVKGAWSDWSACFQTTDGKFKQVRIREVMTAPSNGGYCCPPLEEYRDCQSQDCEVSAWSGWSDCYVNDNNQFVQQRTRTVVKPPLYDGYCCPPLTEEQNCQSQDCKIGWKDANGQYEGQWSDWSGCAYDEALGKTVSRRIKLILQPPVGTGKACPTNAGELEEVKDCNEQDCQVSDWSQVKSDFSDCFETINEKGEPGFYQVQTRKIITPNTDRGKECPPVGELVKYTLCPPIDCEVGFDGTKDWSEWSGCYQDGDKYFRQRVKTVQRYPRFGGKDCPSEEELSQVQECPIAPAVNNQTEQFAFIQPDSTTPTVKHCEWSNWSEPTNCYFNEGLNKYVKTQTREFTQLPANGGKLCPENDDFLVRHIDCAPVDCVVGYKGMKDEWSEWTNCATINGKLQQARYKEVITQPLNGGKECPPVGDLVEFKECASQDCKVGFNGVEGQWSEWSGCYTDKNNKPVKTRIREVMQYPSNEGYCCPPLSETVDCEQVIDCVQGDWSEWSECAFDENVNKYQQYKFRQTLVQPTLEGKPCDTNIMTRDCAAVDCVKGWNGIKGDWSEWTECFLENDLPIQARFQSVLSIEKNGGSCDTSNLREVKACSQDNCVVSDWSEWSDCFVKDGSWVKERVKNIVQYPKNYGKACPPESELKQVEACASINCSQSDWSAWSTCEPVREENGALVYKKYRTRQVNQYDAFNGQQCGPNYEEESCEAKNCEYTQWSDWSECFLDENKNMVQIRLRDVQAEPEFGGMECVEDLYEVKSC